MKCVAFFLLDFQSLKPVFLVCGPNGCGKKILIESVSKYLGVRYINKCCFDWPTNNIAQFKKKIEYFFEDIRKISPCLLHIENVEVNTFLFIKCIAITNLQKMYKSYYLILGTMFIIN